MQLRNFMDEPTGALNRKNTKDVMSLLSSINEQGQSILMVTHDVKSAVHGNRILYLEDGRIMGELKLPPYKAEEAKSRETQISSWLASMRRCAMSILTMIKANLRHKKGNFIGVMFFMFLITFVVTVSFSVSETSKNRAKQSLEESGVGDYWCNLSEDVLTEEMIEKVLNYEEVAGAYNTPGIMISDPKAVTVAGGEAEIKDSFLFQAYDKENAPFPVYTKDQLNYVENPEPLQKGEVYLPVSFQGIYSCKEGDKVKIETETVKTTLVIKGFVEDMTLGNPFIHGMKNVWISDEDFQMLSACEVSDKLLSKENNFNIFRKADSKLTETLLA